MLEAENQKAITRTMDALRHVQIFRNNRGRRGKVTYGLNNAKFKTGTSDLIGWTSVEITPEMVGDKVAIFTALEIKADAKSSYTTNQADFINEVIAAGGRAGFACGTDDAMDIIAGRNTG
jgi:hypothetical protein